ncbi:MAG: GAF domain-containing protein [Anaerolineales bacterium]|nr:GAF domain-containing protein [Anaerolineales bacterium]
MATLSQPRPASNPSSTSDQTTPPSRDPLILMELVINSLGQKSDKIKILSEILPRILALGEVEQGALLVVGNEAHQLTAVIKQKLPDEVIRQFTREELGQQLLAGKQVYLTSQRLQLNPEQALLSRHKLKYLLGLPLQFNKEILGGLIVGSSNDFLRPEAQHRLEALGQLTALFLDHTRLRTQIQRQSQAKVQPDSPPSSSTTHELEELLAAIMSAEEEVVRQNKDLGILNSLSNEVGGILQLNVILEAAVRQTRQALNVEIGWFYIFEEGSLVLREHQGLSEQYVQELRQLKPGDGAEGMAFSRRQPILRDTLLFHSGRARAVVEAEGLRAVAAVPLLDPAGDRALGVLAVGDRTSRQWSPRDQRLLTLICRQVAQAVGNSQTFVEAQKKAATWEAKYSTIQESHAQLVHRTEILEQQIDSLRQVEQQIWLALAASQKARRDRGHEHHAVHERDDQLVAILKKALATLNKDEETPPLAKAS